MTDFQSLFISQLVNTSYAEMTAVFFGLVSVWYAKKEQIWVYPTGIISIRLPISANARVQTITDEKESIIKVGDGQSVSIIITQVN